MDFKDVSFVKRKVAKVLMELLSDERMAGRQHFGFKLSTNADGDRVLGGDANGSVSFELCIPPKRGLDPRMDCGGVECHPRKQPGPQPQR
jgi:hypothetical protein